MEIQEIPLKQIDPHPKQPRTDLGDIKGLAASVAEIGIIQPVVLVKSGRRYVTAVGHRRIKAATMAKLTTVPAVVAKDWDAAAQLDRLMAENTQRKDMTAVEKARGLQSMLDLGATEARVSTITGVSVADIRHVAPIIKQAKAISKDAGMATLEEAAALAEVADVGDDFRLLLASVGSGQFSHTFERIKQNRAREAKRSELAAKLEAEGVRVITENYGQNISGLGMLGITPDDHKDCEGHAAYLSYSGDAISYYCTKANLHRAGAAPGGGLTDEEKAARRAKREGKLAWAAATAVRREHLKLLCVNLQQNVPVAISWISATAWSRGLVKGALKEHTTTWEANIAKVANELLPERNPSHPQESLFAQTCAQMEQLISGWVEQSGGVDLKRAPIGYPEYMKMLAVTGYVPAECEGGTVVHAPVQPGDEIEEID